MEGLIAVALVIVVAVIAAIGYGIYCSIGVVGCWILGGVIGVLLILLWLLDRFNFRRNAPDWYEEALVSDQWITEVSRVPFSVGRVWDDCVAVKDRDIEVVIPTFSLLDSRGRSIVLTRKRSGYSTFICDGSFAGLKYKNEMTIDSVPAGLSHQRYVNVLMKHLCQLAHIE